MFLLAFIYYKYRGLTTVQGVLNGLRPAVIAMIGSAGLELVILAFWNGKGIINISEGIDFVAVVRFAIGFIILRKWKVNPIHVMIGAGIIGLLIYPIT